MSNNELLAVLNHIKDAVNSGIEMIEKGGGAPPEPGGAGMADQTIAQENLLKARKKIDATLGSLGQVSGSEMRELRGRSEQLAAFVDFDSGCS